MNLAAGVMLLGVVLLGSAQAAEQSEAVGAASGKGQKKIAVIQYEYSANKKIQSAQGKNASPVAPSADGSTTATPVAAAVKEKQDDATLAPSDAQGRSVRLKGVRG
ncbi:MAG: hypothetical protein EPO42_13780 [Gallionellaceae bacterium]|nr:MAG: hypothetical protein EPO42_13780 [Gallionellaceae bacterium]